MAEYFEPDSEHSLRRKLLTYTGGKLLFWHKEANMKDKLKAKLKSYGFWVSLASAVMVFLNTLGLKVDIPYLSQVTTAFLSILVIAGILTKPGDGGSSGTPEDFYEEQTTEEAPSEQPEAQPAEESEQPEEQPAEESEQRGATTPAEPAQPGAEQPEAQEPAQPGAEQSEAQEHAQPGALAIAEPAQAALATPAETCAAPPAENFGN